MHDERARAYVKLGFLLSVTGCQARPAVQTLKSENVPRTLEDRERAACSDV
jgi:hypothetical protein